LSEKKRLKYRVNILRFLSQPRVKLADIQSLHGTLQHTCFVYRNGRVFLPSLIHLMSGFRNRFVSHDVSSAVKNDLRWWLAVLDIPAFSRSLHPRRSLDLMSGSMLLPLRASGCLLRENRQLGSSCLVGRLTDAI
jgi:hypothetical protein